MMATKPLHAVAPWKKNQPWLQEIADAPVGGAPRRSEDPLPI